MESTIEAFNWNRFFLNDLPALFLIEVLLRTFIIFLVVLVSLRVVGKRGVRELSVFELIIILTLGSAAGDVSFYEDVPVLPIIAVFIGIIGLYRLVITLISYSEKANHFLEGTPLYFMEQGRFAYDVIKDNNLSQEELVMELRAKSIRHLGEVEIAILETSGEVSIFKYPESKVRPGMPALPRMRKILDKIKEEDFYSCARCAYTRKYGRSPDYICDNCEYTKCMKAVGSYPSNPV